MREVIVNLLTNALKFTPPGGTVLVDTRPQDLSGQHALLTVSDTGIGISPEDLPRVSERFFRSPRTSGYAGSGIGLTIVAEVVRGHHGSLDIASELGAGTKVTVVLPASEAPHPPGKSTKRTATRRNDNPSPQEPMSGL
jgi:signal transduction histidine kinase